MKFGVMFFSSEADASDDPYRLLLDAARFADAHGFASVWTPERHFHPFGGLFPHPAVTSAALATITERVELRSGSLIAPLHDTLRIVETWSMVDNLSRGRAAISFGSGWNVNDFAFYPERYAERRALMFDQIAEIRRLWSGGAVTRTNGDGRPVELRPHPKPIRAELPVWITSSGNPATFRKAGEIGAHLLTHMEHQDDGTLGDKIALYRRARAEHGHDPAAGIVSLMLHTYVGRDTAHARQVVRDPLRAYLKSAVDLEQMAVASGGVASGGYAVGAHTVERRDLDDLLEVLFERYFEQVALTGSVEHCARRVASVRAAGVDEIACLIDFIDDREAVMQGLERLARVVALTGEPSPTAPTDGYVSGTL